MCAEARHNIGLTQFSGPIKKRKNDRCFHPTIVLKLPAPCYTSNGSLVVGTEHGSIGMLTSVALSLCGYASRSPCLLGPASGRWSSLLPGLGSETSGCAKPTTLASAPDLPRGTLHRGVGDTLHVCASEIHQIRQKRPKCIQNFRSKCGFCIRMAHTSTCIY